MPGSGRPARAGRMPAAGTGTAAARRTGTRTASGSTGSGRSGAGCPAGASGPARTATVPARAPVRTCARVLRTHRRAPGRRSDGPARCGSCLRGATSFFLISCGLVSPASVPDGPCGIGDSPDPPRTPTLAGPWPDPETRGVGQPSRVWRKGALAGGWHAGGMRLFAAVTPPDDVLEHLETALASVRGERVSGLRWTLPEARHISLPFGAEVPDGSLHDVVGGLDDVVQVAIGYLAVEGQGDV